MGKVLGSLTGIQADRDGPGRQGWGMQEEDMLSRMGCSGKHKASRHSESCRHRVQGSAPTWSALFDMLATLCL